MKSSQSCTFICIFCYEFEQIAEFLVWRCSFGDFSFVLAVPTFLMDLEYRNLLLLRCRVYLLNLVTLVLEIILVHAINCGGCLSTKLDSGYSQFTTALFKFVHML